MSKERQAVGQICGRTSYGACPSMFSLASRRRSPAKSKTTKLGNFIDAMGACEAENGLPLFGKSPNSIEFLRLEIDAARYIRLIDGGLPRADRKTA